MATIKEIKKYLKENIEEGYKQKDLVKYLIKTGVPKEDVRKAEEEINQEAIPTTDIRDISEIPYKKVFLMTGALFLAVAIIYGSLTLLEVSTDCGYDKQCFIQQANKCESAVVRENLAGTIVMYSTNNCVLTKEMEKIAETEPEQVKLLFQGKSMKCPYSEQAFNPLLVESIITSTPVCSGDLKMVLNEISIVQYELGA